MSTFEWVVVVLVVLLVLGGGSRVAIWWWRLVARAAPYQDEIDRSKGRRARPEDEAGVVVVGGPKRSDPDRDGVKS